MIGKDQNKAGLWSKLLKVTMSTSSFDFSPVISTIFVATVRVLPNVIQNPGSAYDVFISLNPLVSSFWLTITLVMFQILISFITSTISINDRLWPLIPPLHALLYLMHPILSRPPDKSFISFIHPRLFLMTCLVLIWSIRLTIHAIHRGVYNKNSCDYRYQWLRKHIIKNKLLYSSFHSSIVCTLFTILMSSVCGIPMYIAWISIKHKNYISYIDIIASIIMLISIFVQSISDKQQQQFQNIKNSKRNNNLPEWLNVNDVKDGFIQSGLFKRCRHPNYCSEIMIWFAFYLFTFASGASFFNWSVISPICYAVLFQGSTAITEYLSNKKYSKYVYYQKHVPKLYFSVVASWKNNTKSISRARKFDCK